MLIFLELILSRKGIFEEVSEKCHVLLIGSAMCYKLVGAMCHVTA